MAEFAAAALTTIAGTTAAAAPVGVVGTAGAMAVPTFGAASAGLLSGLGGVSTVASILGGTATVASVLAAQRAGEEKAQSLELAALDAEADSAIEVNRGTERRTGLRKQLLATLGAQDVATAAAGVDLSFGTPAQARSEATREAETALDVDRSTEDLRRSRLAERAASYRKMAGQSRAGGLAKAASLALTGAATLAKRY